MSGAGTQKVSKTGPRPGGVTALSQTEVSSWEHRELGIRDECLPGGEEGSLDGFRLSFIEQVKWWPTKGWPGGHVQFSKSVSLQQRYGNRSPCGICCNTSQHLLALRGTELSLEFYVCVSFCPGNCPTRSVTLSSLF